MRTKIHENFLLRLDDGTWNVYTEDGTFELIGNFPSRDEAVDGFIARFGGLPSEIL